MLVCLVSGVLAEHRQQFNLGKACYAQAIVGAPNISFLVASALQSHAIATCHQKKRLMMRLQMMSSQMYLMDEFLFSFASLSLTRFESYLQCPRIGFYHHIIIIIFITFIIY